MLAILSQRIDFWLPADCFMFRRFSSFPTGTLTAASAIISSLSLSFSLGFAMAVTHRASAFADYCLELSLICHQAYPGERIAHSNSRIDKAASFGNFNRGETSREEKGWENIPRCHHVDFIEDRNNAGDFMIQEHVFFLCSISAMPI